MYCEKMLELMHAIQTVDENRWEAFIYESFTSNNCLDFGAIYTDFPVMTSFEFIDKWKSRYTATTPIEQWYETCKLYFFDYRESEATINSVNKLLEDISC